MKIDSDLLLSMSGKAFDEMAILFNQGFPDYTLAQRFSSFYPEGRYYRHKDEKVEISLYINDHTEAEKYPFWMSVVPEIGSGIDPERLAQDFGRYFVGNGAKAFLAADFMETKELCGTMVTGHR